MTIVFQLLKPTSVSCDAEDALKDKYYPAFIDEYDKKYSVCYSYLAVCGCIL